MSTIAIVGVGLIGGSIGLALKRAGVGRILGVSRSETLREAVRLGAIDKGVPYGRMGDVLGEAEVVFLCTPVHRILELLPEVLGVVKEGAVVTDVGSTKERILARAEQSLRCGVAFVGGHPMAGAEGRGVKAADPFLFQNAVYALVPAKDTPGWAMERMVELVEKLGARAALLDASTHDRIVALVSHLPQMVAVALVGLVGRMAEEEPLYLRMAAGGFRDMTRIASSPFEVWEDICRTNSSKISEAIDLLIDELMRLKGMLEDPKLGEAFRFAAETRGTIPKDAKGFLRPLYELRVVAEDRPGVIAGIASPLAEAGINIKDMEVLKVREDEGGTLRLAFGSPEDLERALEILKERGFEVSSR
ncbi:MAG: prephenate dehydrogenase [Candidatus Latescibacterota bacterium]|nr:MAG: prephenate dehydrogenase [Candidatus Latescibacterota bacterium]